MTDPANVADERVLKLLLRAEFAEFRIALFTELQNKLDAKADRLPFELLAKDVSDLKATASRRQHLETDVDSLLRWRAEAQQEAAVEMARDRGARSVWGVLKRASGWIVAFGLAVTDLLFKTVFK